MSDAQGADPEAADLMRRQAPLLEAAEELSAAVDEDHSGYAGLAISPERGTVRLYWHGTVPDRIRRMVADLNNPHRDVAVVGARYTFRQLQDEADRLIHVDGVVAVGANSDGSGLLVTLDQRLKGKRPAHVDSTVATTVQWGGPFTTLPFPPPH